MGSLKELLATPDRVRITTPVLPRPTLERVLEILRQEGAGDDVRVDNPTQNLESYFLGVVARAKQTEETSGATSGARVAAYLRGDADQPVAKADKLLERLTLPAAAEAPAPAVAIPAPAVDEAKLATLTEHHPEPATPPPPTPKTPPADLAKADEKLADLLGGKS